MFGKGKEKKKVKELEEVIQQLLETKQGEGEMSDEYDIIKEVFKVHTGQIKKKGITTDYTLSDLEKAQRDFIQRRTVSIHRLMNFLDIGDKVKEPKIEKRREGGFVITYKELSKDDKNKIADNAEKINDAFSSNLTLMTILSRCRGGQVLKSVLNRFGAAAIINANSALGGVKEMITRRNPREEV